MRKYTIEQLSEGNVAVENNGTLKQLQELLILAFPDDNYRFEEGSIISKSTFYYKNRKAKVPYNCWSRADETDLPTQSVRDFVMPEWVPRRGEYVFVKDEEDTMWSKRIFIAKLEGCLNPYVMVACGDEADFLEGCSFSVDNWDEMKQLIPEEPKVEVSVMIDGEESTMTFAKSQWDKLMKLND